MTPSITQLKHNVKKEISDLVNKLDSELETVEKNALYNEKQKPNEIASYINSVETLRLRLREMLGDVQYDFKE